MQIKTVIFDCDGTLVDSELLANTVLVECVAPFGLRISAVEAMQRYVGGKLADCISDLESRLGHKLPATFVTELRSRTAIAFRSRLKPIEGALETLSKLDLPVCVASSGPMEKIELSLDVTGLTRFFTKETIFSAYDVGFWKPDPRLFLHAAHAMGVLPGHCVVVEDSLPGVQAGIAAGMHTLWFRPQGKPPPSVTALHRLVDLPEIIAQVSV